MDDNTARRERRNAERGNKEEIEIWTKVLFTHTPVICALILEREGTKLSALSHTLCMCMTAVKIPRSLGSCKSFSPLLVAVLWI